MGARNLTPVLFGRTIGSLLWIGAGLVASACSDGATTSPIPPQSGTIIGRVIDTRGSPVAGASIFTDPFVPSRTTDAAGHFEITDLPFGQEYLVTATKQGFLSSSVRVPVSRAQPIISIELTIARLAVARGAPGGSA